MNLISVSGKNWILKKYNEEDISFLKENFSFNEIISKLLSIRNIKKEVSKHKEISYTNRDFGSFDNWQKDFIG